LPVHEATHESAQPRTGMTPPVKPQSNQSVTHRFCVAPMMDWMEC
jgi:hypothetical protein